VQRRAQKGKERQSVISLVKEKKISRPANKKRREMPKRGKGEKNLLNSFPSHRRRKRGGREPYFEGRRKKEPHRGPVNQIHMKQPGK